MAQGGASLSPADAAALGHAFQALQRGDLAAAREATARVLARAPDAPDALHVHALCLRHQGDFDGAAQAFEHALRGAPTHPDILNNYGSLFQRAGQSAEAAARYKTALTAHPQRGDIWINLSIALMSLRDYAGAELAAAQAVSLAPHAVRPLLARAAAQRELGDFEAAEASLRRALEIEPGNGAAWTALGVVRRVVGDPAESLVCYAKARATGYQSVELADAEASAQLDLGQVDDALAGVRALTAAAPAYVPGHVALAHILWEHGAKGDNDPLAPFARAIEAQPQHAQLRAAYANMLIEANRPDEALAQLRILRAERDDPALVAAYAAALEMQGDLAGASETFAEALPRMGVPQGMGTAYAQHLIRVGRGGDAAQFALLDAERDPKDQQAWATLSIAWRLTNDPREHWLCDYERYVMPIDVEPPAGFADQASFIAALTETLNAMHTAQHAPLNQSLRGGSQTTGGLFGRPDPIIAGARDALRASVRTLIARLPDDPKHPFLRYKAADVSFTGSWSVRLRSAGKHVNHFHPKGWLSSAFYVQLPPSVASDDGAHSGWIQFGQPPAELQTNLTPRRVVRPKVGSLVLFPSYMWHGTVPFADIEPRMTMAFDAVPKA